MFTVPSMRKSQIKLIITFLVIGFSIFSLNLPTINAHDPADVKPKYHYTEQILEVEFHHPVMFLDIHYVNNVQIRRNGVLVGNYSYDSQPSDDLWTYNYSISAVHFDILKVRVFCTYQGDTEVEIMVLDPSNPTTVPPTKEFGPTFLGLIFTICATMVFISRYKKNRK